MVMLVAFNHEKRVQVPMPLPIFGQKKASSYAVKDVAPRKDSVKAVIFLNFVIVA